MDHINPPSFDITSFDVISELGSGTFAKVNLLFHKDLKEHMVGKFFAFSGNAEVKKKVTATAEREAKILACISHSNIVCVKGITVDEEKFGIIMEYVSCGDLESFLLMDTQISLPWKIRTRFFKELADGLDYLHHDDPLRRFIHGDLKPQNILLTDTLKIKIADFGSTTIAISIDANRFNDGNRQHTPFYTAPEFLKNLYAEKATSMDVYSYGMIGYEILTRSAVYKGCNIPLRALMELIKSKGQNLDLKILDDIYDSSLEKGSEDSKIFSELRNIAQRCWQYEPEDRPNMHALKQDLKEMDTSYSIYDAATNEMAKELVSVKTSKSTFQSHQSKEASKQGFRQNMLAVCYDASW